jgi:hypothetical protein
LVYEARTQAPTAVPKSNTCFSKKHAFSEVTFFQAAEIRARKVLRDSGRGNSGFPGRRRRHHWDTAGRNKAHYMTHDDSAHIKQLATRLTEVERTLRNTIAEIERTTLSHINHNPMRFAEAERSLKNVDLQRLNELQHVLRKLRLG